MHRHLAWGSVLASALLLAACGGPPEAPGDGTGVTPNGDAGAPSGTNGSGGSGAGINIGGETPEAGSGALPGDGGSTGDTAPICGDSQVDPPETCDDGNATPGDGCDGNCTVEVNWQCGTPGSKCVYNPTAGVCGNGTVEAGEQCDLGSNGTTNLNDDSAGCSATCQTMAGWTCPTNVSGGACTKNAFCGDSIVQGVLGEQCDDGANDGTHGCNGTCKVVTGWKCSPTGGACSPDVYCGNGKIDGTEQCDDHNLRNFDGCTSTCFVETGWVCPSGGGACTRICGNGVLDAGETCDDSNFYSGDGCSSTCQTETNYTCSPVGQSCVYTPPPPPSQCGNGKIETGEVCDDGNPNSGDGCSSSCQIENGWQCTAQNIPCVAKQCGDKILAGSETCDDGKVDNLHGCSSTCTVMPNAVCPASGGDCIPMVCGDKVVTGTETCDDGKNDGKHGCSASCQIMTGWVCPLAGTACTAVCGDGKVAGDEQCDEGGAATCCTAACKLVPGYVCDPSKTPHSQPATPYCGNGTLDGPSNASATVRGAEQCDDGNTLAYDGCSPTCTNEPLCGTVNTSLPLAQQATVTYQCFATCGDGLILPPEECDDGNAQNGDGCDSSCKIEKITNTTTPAWTCTQGAQPSTLSIPVIWRDFTPKTHGQFEIDPQIGRRLPGIAQDTLTRVLATSGARKYKYVPAYNPYVPATDTGFKSPTWGVTNTGVSYSNVPNWTMNGPNWVSGTDGLLSAQNPAKYTTAQMSAAFLQWYVDDSTVNMTFNGTLPLKTVTGGALQYSCVQGACDGTTATDGYFPLDGKGWVAAGQETARAAGGSTTHNFHFTTEARYWFAFQGGENLAFYGDDDVWVFVNGVLTLDIGGIHGQTHGNFTLNADGTATSCAENLANGQASDTVCSTISLGLVKKTVYEVAVFNAERHVTGSNFQLSLKGFNNQPSVCAPICGDGYVAGSEQCDRGDANVAPGGNTYGKCTTQCKLGPYCGDKSTVNQSPPEACDNGLNIDAYVSTVPSGTMCAPMCLAPLYCGDGKVQKLNGEECDDGTAANNGAYNHCSSVCKLGARCGDKQIQAGNGETCDDGANNGTAFSNCSATCQVICGNHQLDAGEACDDGTGPTGNGTATSKCGTNCQLKCGNGVVDVGEQCDGKNDGSYGNCTSTCTFGPFCGDGAVHAPEEVCDKGASNSPSAYGPDFCTDRCLPGGSCGDGVVNGNEKCDVGNNTGMPGSCTMDCSAYVPSTLCGDGKIQAPETCDDGSAVNGTAGSKCDTACRFKCGNALMDAGEQCDNGVNDGSYGTCTSTCMLAPHCGDGMKNGNEQCDNGAGNLALASAYGPGVCTTTCKNAPFCGDGHVQSKFEGCEGNVNCVNCQSTGVH